MCSLAMTRNRTVCCVVTHSQRACPPVRKGHSHVTIEKARLVTSETCHHRSISRAASLMIMRPPSSPFAPRAPQVPLYALLGDAACDVPDVKCAVLQQQLPSLAAGRPGGHCHESTGSHD